MLQAEPDRLYYVFPSRARLPYRWRDVRGMLWNPRKSRFFDPTGDISLYPLKPPPIDYLECGDSEGGLFVIHAPPDDPWLRNLVAVLGGYALFRAPPGTPPGPLLELMGCHVYYLEPMDLKDFGLPRPRLYLCGVTPENADAAGDDLYWAVVTESKVKADRVLAKLIGSAPHFGLQVEPAVPSDALRAETADWFVDRRYSVNWFDVRGGTGGIGWNLAVLLWLGLDLRGHVGKSLKAVHLIGQIQGRPNFRRSWAGR